MNPLRNIRFPVFAVAASVLLSGFSASCKRTESEAEVPTQPNFKVKLMHSSMLLAEPKLPEPGDGPSAGLAGRADALLEEKRGHREVKPPGARPVEILARPELAESAEQAALAATGLSEAPCVVQYDRHFGNEGRVVVIHATGDEPEFVRASLQGLVDGFLLAWDTDQRPDGLGTRETLGAARDALVAEIERDQAAYDESTEKFPPSLREPELEGLRRALPQLLAQKQNLINLKAEDAAKASALLAAKRSETEAMIAELERGLADQAALKKVLDEKTAKLGELDAQEASATAGAHRADTYRVTVEVTRVDIAGGPPVLKD